MAKNEKTMEGLMGVLKYDMVEHRAVLKNNLEVQRTVIEEEIMVLEGRLALKKEYLAKIEGGIDVLDELK